MKSKKTLGIILLFLTAFIWGSSFVAQSDAMDYIEPLTMNGMRSLLAALSIGITIIVTQSVKEKKLAIIPRESSEQHKKNLIAGLVCGAMLTCATTVQQYGIARTTVGRSGFITALYIVMVPIIGLFFGDRPKWNLWVAVCAALVGFALICLVGNGFQLSIGDLLVLISAIFYALHIFTVGKIASKVNGLLLSFMQFAVCAAVNLALAFIFEKPDFSAMLQAWWPIIYAGVFSGGIAYTFQIIGQKHVPSAVAVLIMSLESVIAAISGRVLKHESMAVYEVVGCVLVFGAVVLAQLNFGKNKRRGENPAVDSEN